MPPFNYQPRQISVPAMNVQGPDAGGLLSMAMRLRGMSNQQKLYDERERQIADAGIVREAFNQGKGQRKRTIQILQGKGRFDLAEQADQTFSRMAKAQMDETRSELQTAATGLAQITGLMSAVKDAGIRAPDQWRSVIGQVREAIPEAMRDQIPQEYDPQFVERAVEWGKTHQQRLAERREAIDAMEQGFDDDTQALTRLKPWLENASPEERERYIEIARNWWPTLTDGFDEMARSLKPEPKTGRAGYEQALTKEKGGPLTSEERLGAERRWSAAGRKPEAEGAEALDDKGIADAMEELQDDYATINDKFRRTGMAESGPLTENQAREQMFERLNIYRQRRGWEPYDRLPNVPQGWVMMRAPSGEERPVPRSKVREGLRRGFEVVPMPPTLSSPFKLNAPGPR